METLGEDRVRITFNPTSNDLVDQIKQDTARLINLINGHKDKDPRLAALAMTTYEEAAMWGVKLATSKESK